MLAMPRKDDLPFAVGQEVEATYNEKGFRGAWFRCQILQIDAAKSRLLLRFLDFPDEAHDWTPVRMARPAVKSIGPWLKKKPSNWMVRPVIPIVHESDVDKYREDVRMGRKCSGHVYIFNDMYTVGDMVDWLKDDCFWGAKIVEINIESNKAKLKLFLPPVGEGDGNTQEAPLKDLRPSFRWNPKHRWRPLGLKNKVAGTGVENCKSNKPHIQREYLSGDSITPAVMPDDRCGPISSGSSSFICKSQVKDPAVNSQGTPREESHKNSDSDELVLNPENVYDRVKLRRKSIVNGAKSLIKQASPHVVKLDKGRRKVQFSSSHAMPDTGEEVQTSPIGKPENIDGVLEQLRNCTGVGDSMNNTTATAEEDLPEVEFSIHNIVLENEVRATCSTPSNAVDREVGTVVPELVGDKINLPVESLGSCLATGNADELVDQTTEVDGDGTSNVWPQMHFVVPQNVLENLPSPDSIGGCADDLSVAKTQVFSRAHDGGTAPQEEITDSGMIVYSGKRRRDLDQVKISRKHLCRINRMRMIDDSNPKLPLQGSLDTCKSQNLRQSESDNQELFLSSGNVPSKVNSGLKRKQVDNLDSGKDIKKMRADLSTKVVEAVGNSLTLSGVEVPRMRGSIKLKHHPRGKSDPENKSTLQPDEYWCIKDGKLVCEVIERFGSSSTKEESHSLHDPVNLSSIPKEKGLTSHTSSSCLREQAGGNHLSSESLALNEKLLESSMSTKSIIGYSYKSGSTAVERNVGRIAFIAKDANETAVDISSLNKTAGADTQEGGVQDAGAPEITNKVVKIREQEPSVISIKKEASVELGVETSTLFTTGDIQGRINTVMEAKARSPTEAPLDSSCREKVVNAGKDIRSGGIVQVKMEASGPPPVEAAVSAYDTWIHDTVKCCHGKAALDRVSVSVFETTQEIEVAHHVKMALWRGLCCSTESCGLGQDLFQRVQLLLQPRMLLETQTDGDSCKILLRSGKPGDSCAERDLFKPCRGTRATYWTYWCDRRA
ncbi:hypothetical protein M758_2G107800 [Ceratodon purpureus]|nr:hypothetical protein M758_2G107800 [Ceratodon purpureus]